MGFFHWVKGVIERMFFKTDAKRIFDTDILLSDTMDKAVKMWNRIYSGRPDWLDEENHIKTIFIKILRRYIMLAKYWKKIGMLILIIACVFNIMSKLVHKLSLNSEMLYSAEYMYEQQQNSSNEENQTN